MIACDIIPEWTVGNWLAFYSLLIGTGTLILGIIAYNKFLLKQLREKQLSVVCDFIQQINDEWNLFKFHNVKSELRSNWGNVFDIAELPEITENANFYIFSEESEHRFYPNRGVVNNGENDIQDQRFDEIIFFEFFRFHNNPLLPKSIANVLKKFSISYPSGTRKYDEIRKEERYVIMGKKKKQDNQTDCHFYNDKLTWKEYVTLCVQLKEAIITWGEKYGLDDLNVTYSHNFKSKL